MIISILKKLKYIYLKCDFKYTWVFYLSIFTSLLVSVMEASFVASIFALIKNITGSLDNTFFFNNKIFVNLKNFFNFDSFTFILLLSSLIIIIVTLLKILNTFLNTFLYYKINSLVSFKIFFNTIKQDLQFHNITNSSLFVSAIIQKSKSIGEITFFILGIIKSIFMLTAITIIAVFISSNIFLLFFLIFLSIFLIIYIIFKSNLKKIGIAISSYSDKVTKTLQESYQSIIYILLYSCQKLVGKNFQYAIEQLRKNEAKTVFFSTVPYIFVQTFTVLGVLFFIYFFELKNNFIDLIPLAAMWLLAIQRLIPSFNEIFSSLSTIKALKKNFSDVDYFLNLKLKYEKSKKKIIFEKYITFKKVTFSFKTNSDLIFDKINLKIKKNSIFGIKGKTGSGKSTLLNILMGFYEPTEGNVYIDNTKLSNSKLFNWQKKISYVPQKIFLIDDTIESNIAFAETNLNKNLINKVVEICELSDFINKQKEGLKAIIGENANRISGGQKQRIGIARALYKNTNILILDESLNSLDYKTKIKILHKIKKLNKTIIIISHDKNDLIICDQIFDMDKLK